ncbi:ATP-binding protein [Candidatus Karelsulcia muelleri]|uniref:ATP-binding protein n=1 Tax=Candidatus Karelsulcia muelleri TaxID=336810 RepID=UPI0021682103|nr:ATP-binding protein [Candidatus Karelsulcia muelleri]
MTDVIKFLSNKSGDVIHILKEILENSIDAYAENIKIILKNGGKNRIHIIDDGIGMSKNDAIKSFERKIESTKGFEALTQIETRYIESDIGIRLIIENGKLKYNTLPIAMDKGCSICIKNIKIPAKRKYSKLELKNMINEFYKLVLSHNDINFYLENDNKILFDLKSSSYKKRIIQMMGEKMKDFLIKITKTKGYITKGYITKYYKSNKLEQNNRDAIITEGLNNPELCKQINSKECLGINIKNISNVLLKQVNVKKLSTREITYFNNEYKKLIKKIK